MSGHSKWSSIKHQKGAADAKRGQLFTKLTREIIIAVRQGGANPDGNARLRLAMQKARDARMPNDNIKRAIEKGEGNTEGQQMFEATFEGYGPGGSAVMVDVVSDNRNRAVQEIRSTFSRAGGNLGESGGVAWMFENRGVISIPAGDVDIDEISLQAIDAGAQDIYPQSEYIEIYTAATDLEAVRKTLEENGVEIESAELSKIPTTTISLDEQTSFQVLRLLEKLEELDDVQNVYSNVDFTDELIENFRAQSR